jgi:hypothetical protein
MVIAVDWPVNGARASEAQERSLGDPARVESCCRAPSVSKQAQLTEVLGDASRVWLSIPGAGSGGAVAFAGCDRAALAGDGPHG